MFLDLDESRVLTVTPDQIATECTVVLGMRGSGKSNTVARVLEQAMSHGVTASIIDPHNEYAGLRERYPVYIAGQGADIPIQPQHGTLLAEWVYRNRASVILAIKDFDTDERQRFLLAYCQRLKRLHMTERRAHLLTVEEAHNFIPQVGSHPLKHELGLIAIEGRKFGLGMLISDQRSANIDKTVLTQAGILLLHRATGVTDLNTYQDIADLADTKQRARKLRIGEAIAILHYDVNFEATTVQIKRRETTHGGDTPSLISAPGAVPQSALASLAALLAKHTEDEESEQAKLIKSLKAQVRERDEQLTVLSQSNQELSQRVRTLSVIRVEMPTTPPASAMAVDRLEAKAILSPIVTHQQTPTPQASADLHESVKRNANQLADHAQKMQRRAFDTMLNTIQSADRMQVFILKALIPNEDRVVSLKELQATTGYKAVTIASHGLGPIATLGLAENIRGKGYRSKVRVTLRERFPSLDTEQLIHELLEIRR